LLCRFAIVPAHEADVSVAKCLLNANQDELDRILGDKRPKPVSSRVKSQAPMGAS
jgi:hypothetical protein